MLKCYIKSDKYIDLFLFLQNMKRHYDFPFLECASKHISYKIKNNLRFNLLNIKLLCIKK